MSRLMVRKLMRKNPRDQTIIRHLWRTRQPNPRFGEETAEARNRSLPAAQMYLRGRAYSKELVTPSNRLEVQRDRWLKRAKYGRKEMKQKLLLIPLMVFLVMAVPMKTTVSAGTIDAMFDSDDDMHTEFHAGGGVLDSEIYFDDYGDNPYGYGVDTTEFKTKTSYSGSGYIYLDTWKTDNYEPMYGSPGQYSHTYIDSSCTGYLEWRDWANYASFKQCQYSWSMTNFGATGDYMIDHHIEDADGDRAMVGAMGCGSADFKLQGSEAGGKNSYFNMGCLPVCGDGEAWDDNYATFAGTGVGQFDVHAWADHEIYVHEGGITIPGDGSDDSAQYHLTVMYSGSWSYPDYGVKGN